MTFIPLTYKNFVKNKINNTIKVSYKDSNSDTFIYDNHLDSKSIINTVPYSELSIEEVGLSNNNNDELGSIDRFFRVSDNFIKNTQNRSSLKEFINEKNTLINGSNITNDNIKEFRFRNSYNIERIEQKFLPSSFELQKKNFVKKNLYRDYNENYSLDFYNSLEYGFCNWNTINFFSQRFDTVNIKNHSNCIVWPNTKNTTSNQYDFIDKSFNLSFYINLRKNYSSYNEPECVFHVPDFFSIYMIRSYNDTEHRIAIVLGDKTKEKLKNLQNLNFQLNTDQDNLLSQGIYVSSDLNILNNRWYNLSFNYFKNQDQTRDIEIFIDGSIVKRKTITIARENSNIQNSYICVGNKPEYDSNSNFEHVFYQFFAREFDKDISLGTDNQWLDDNTIDTTNNFLGNIHFEASSSQSPESFHGEIHDIRIYNQTLSEEKVLNSCTSVIESLSSEVLEGLIFYVPVHYLPVYTRKKGPFNASSDKLNLRYSCIYNPYLANSCGGLDITAENYLIDFVKNTKPNVVIGGEQQSYVYSDNIASSLNMLLSNTDDIKDIKEGKTTFSIYNKNLIDSNHSQRENNVDSNLSYKNLLILPNDNGIQKVRFDVIEEVLSKLNKENTLQYNQSKVNLKKPFNISIEDIFSDNVANSNSWYNDDSLRVPDFRDITEEDEFQGNIITSVNIRKNSKNFEFKYTKDKIFNVSNFIYHDDRITDITPSAVLVNSNDPDNSVVNIINKYNSIKNSGYKITESNPIIRNYKQDAIDITYFNSSNVYFSKSLEYNENVSINYLKLPTPYSTINFDYDSIFTNIFDISNKFYNKKIKKNSLILKDNNLSTSNNNLDLTFKDNKNSFLFRSNCLTKVAEWNYVGHIFYNEGIISLNRPELCYFGVDDFEVDFESDFSMFVHEINIPVDAGLFDKSLNNTHDDDLRHDESAFNSEESFVYITDINLHDENLNVVARAKLARPAPKKKSDSILFRLKMDY